MKIDWDQLQIDSGLAAVWTGIDDREYGAALGRAKCKRSTFGKACLS